VPDAQLSERAASSSASASGAEAAAEAEATEPFVDVNVGLDAAREFVVERMTAEELLQRARSSLESGTLAKLAGVNPEHADLLTSSYIRAPNALELFRNHVSVAWRKAGCPSASREAVPLCATARVRRAPPARFAPLAAAAAPSSSSAAAAATRPRGARARGRSAAALEEEDEEEEEEAEDDDAVAGAAAAAELAKRRMVGRKRRATVCAVDALVASGGASVGAGSGRKGVLLRASANSAHVRAFVRARTAVSGGRRNARKREREREKKDT